MKSIVILTSMIVSIGSFALPGTPVAPSVMPKQLDGVGIEEKTGAQLDLNLEFIDESGTVIPLRKIINGTKPVVLGLVYYGCPSLCNFFMNGVTDVLKDVKWNPGEEFEVLMISIDPNEKPELAKEKKENHLKAYGRVETAKGWHFLTGSQESIKKITESTGFKYKWDPQTEQWNHASAAIIVTPQGQISRYLYGIMFDAGTLKLSLVEAGKNKIGGLVERILLFCYRFDPTQNKYTLYAMNVMRATAALTVVIMGLILIPYWRRNRLFRKQGDSTV